MNEAAVFDDNGKWSKLNTEYKYRHQIYHIL